jgi:glucan-binding YG repeat protein
LKPYHAASVDDDDTVVDEANADAEGSVFRSQAGTGSAVDDPGGSVDDPGGGNTDDLSPRLPRRREFKRHLFVVDSLDKHIHIQNVSKKEERWKNPKPKTETLTPTQHQREKWEKREKDKRKRRRKPQRPFLHSPKHTGKTLGLGAL